MRSIRGGRGFGDTLYLQAIVRHMLTKGGRLMRVATDYPDVFIPLGKRVQPIPFTRSADLVAHYISRKAISGTTQFQDCCLNVGINEPVELKLDWTITRPDLVELIRGRGKPVMVVQLPRTPMGRTDGFGASLLPDCRILQQHIDNALDTHTVVQIGKGEPLFRFKRLTFDFANELSVAQSIDVVAGADKVLGYPSYMIPLAESLDKPATWVWSYRGTRDQHVFIRRITPAKLIHKPVLSKWHLDTEAVR